MGSSSTTWTAALIAGNFIGTDPSGVVDLGNGFGGIALSNSRNVVIGGPSAADGNVVSGNNGDGISLFNFSGLPGGNIVLGNFDRHRPDRQPAHPQQRQRGPRQRLGQPDRRDGGGPGEHDRLQRLQRGAGGLLDLLAGDRRQPDPRQLDLRQRRPRDRPRGQRRHVQRPVRLRLGAESAPELPGDRGGLPVARRHDDRGEPQQQAELHLLDRLLSQRRPRPERLLARGSGTSARRRSRPTPAAWRTSTSCSRESPRRAR